MPALLQNLDSASLDFIQRPIYASRVYSRRRVNLRVQLLARRTDGRIAIIHARTVDLSRSGAGVTLTREISSGTEVVLCLRLPGSSNMHCLDAIVTRSRGFRVGLEFVQPTAEQRLLLCEFCYTSDR